MHHSTSCFPRTIGIDLSPRKSAFCVVDVDGTRLEEGFFRTERLVLEELLRRHAESRVVIEACASARWVAEVIEGLGHELVVANPRTFKLVSSNPRKCDRNDARILAEYGQFRPNLLGPVVLRTMDEQMARAVLVARNTLVEARTQLVNSARSLVRELGEVLPSCAAERFHVRVRELIPHRIHHAVLPLLDALEGIAGAIQRHDARIAQLVETQFPVARLLQQVPGVGPITALAFVVTIGDPSRFARSREVGSYFGLVPRSHASCSRRPELPISKCGDTYCRRLLVSCASYILRDGSPDTDLKRWGLALRERGGQAARAKSRTAVARKLAVLLHRLWVTGEVYEPLRNLEAKVA